MSKIHNWKNFALSIACAAGMVGFAGTAQARSKSGDSDNHSVVRNAQQQLQSDGFYKGQIDGIDGPKTHAAIRQYQQKNNLTANGRLDRQTRDKLGLSSQGEANRSAKENEQGENQNSSANTANGAQDNNGQRWSASTIKSVQQQLEQKGLYKGKVNGVMNSKTHAAIRQYQQQNNLTVTGKLDQQTMDSLGVSNNGSMPNNSGSMPNNNGSNK